jgi:hypothetical protein
MDVLVKQGPIWKLSRKKESGDARLEMMGLHCMMDMTTVTRLGRIPISYYRERSLEAGDSILFVFF